MSSPTALQKRRTPTWLRVLLIIVAVVVALMVIGLVAWVAGDDGPSVDVEPQTTASRSP